MNFELRGDLGSIRCKGCLPTIIISAVISGVLLGIFGAAPFFLIPLQIVFTRSGAKPYFVSALAALVIGVVLRFLLGPEIGETLKYDFSTVIGTFAALTVLNWNGIFSRPDLPSWLRVAIAAVLLALMSILELRSFESQGGWDELKNLPGLTALISEDALPRFSGMNSSGSIGLIQALLFRTMSVSINYVFLLAYGMGRVMAQGFLKTLGGLRNYRLPTGFIWLLILSAVGIMAGEKLGINPLSYVAWNLFLTTGMMYMLQGLAISVRYSDGRPQFRLMMPGLVVTMIIVPMVNVVLAIALSVIGISSIWIGYSNGTDGNPTNGTDGSAGSS